MFICSCNALSDEEIADAARRCTGDVVACYHMLGADPICGTCLENAEDIIARVRGRPAKRKSAKADTRHSEPTG